MTLDIRTMLVMISAMTLMFSVLLALAGMHAGNIRGVWHWALASLLISCGLSITFTQQTLGSGWPLVAGVILLMSGSALQLSGILAFREIRFDGRILAALVFLVTLQNIWLAVIHPNTPLRAILNSLELAALGVACARVLLIRIEPPLRTAYWFSGVSFAVLTVFYLVRAVVIATSGFESYGLYQQVPINPVMFFVGGIVQLCLTFGFILMLNYRMSAELEKLAGIDPMTGALNRRSMEEQAARLLARCARTGEVMTVMMLDIDHFKAINDRYGHLTGDEVIKVLTAVARSCIRFDDYFSRYGGEEFCILLPGTSEEKAAGLAERLRQSYAEVKIERGEETFGSTVSIGIACSQEVGPDLHALIAAADQAMYQAKRSGRNQVVTHTRLKQSWLDQMVDPA